MSAAASNTLVRIFDMMQLIPIYPRWVTAKQILNLLTDRGYQVTKRTVERDLNKFSDVFGLVCSDSPDGYKWSFSRDSNAHFMPSLSTAEALSLELVQTYLNDYLPASVTENLAAIFKKSKDVLNRDMSINQWQNKIAAVSPGFNMQVEQVSVDIKNAMYQGILEQKQVEILYGNNQKTHVIEPLGLVIRDTKLVVVCRYKGFTDIRHILCHRVAEAEVKEQSFTTDFDIKKYVKTGAVSMLLEDEPIELQVQAKGYAKTSFIEGHFKGGKIEPIADSSWVNVTVTVPHTMDLERWLQSQAENIKIIGPEHIKQNVLNKLKAGLDNF